MNKNIIMMGATGAVGGKTLEQLINMKAINEIVLLGRNLVNDVSSKKVTQYQIDVTQPSSYSAYIQGSNIAICTLGIGEPSKASKEKFIAIDKIAVLDFAKQCKLNGVEAFHLLASVGINSTSLSFYLRTKGELVDELEAMNFSRLSVYQPSMIITPKNRYGISQAIVLKIWPWLNPLMLGSMKKYRGIKVKELGNAIANNVLRNFEGTEKLTWQNFKDLQ